MPQKEGPFIGGLGRVIPRETQGTQLRSLNSQSLSGTLNIRHSAVWFAATPSLRLPAPFVVVCAPAPGAGRAWAALLRGMARFERLTGTGKVIYLNVPFFFFFFFFTNLLPSSILLPTFSEINLLPVKYLYREREPGSDALDQIVAAR